ncbi:hypothetical protein [Anaerotignum sp.]|uniref:hypothetical protein n=1 Tax=Anaerotignum sp. TaxID=2039241 RepID=UPI0028988CD2|nr:hypothetical protein [Anaerotignum sp.]
MAETYFMLVINQKRTCDITNTEMKLVPLNWRSEVEALLNVRGYDTNGFPLEK